MTTAGAFHRLLRAIAFGSLAAAAACHKPTADEHFARGNELAKEGRVREAILDYRAAVVLDPKRGDIRIRLTDAYVATGDKRAALAEAVRAADLLPNDIPAQLRAGSLLVMARSFEDAKARANAILALQPNHPEGLILLGNTLAGLQDLDGALTEYQQAVIVNPDDEFAYLSVAAVQAVRGNPKEAEAAFRKALELAPKNVQVLKAFANFLWSQSRVKET